MHYIFLYLMLNEYVYLLEKIFNKNKNSWPPFLEILSNIITSDIQLIPYIEFKLLQTYQIIKLSTST